MYLRERGIAAASLDASPLPKPSAVRGRASTPAPHRTFRATPGTTKAVRRDDDARDARAGRARRGGRRWTATPRDEAIDAHHQNRNLRRRDADEGAVQD